MSNMNMVKNGNGGGLLHPVGSRLHKAHGGDLHG